MAKSTAHTEDMTGRETLAPSAMEMAEQPDDSRELRELYASFGDEHLVPLWTEAADLMPRQPTPGAVPHVWQWQTLYPLAQRSGDLVPVGRGGQRRAIALANPGLGGLPYATPTLWAAIQYLGPHEVAPEHRHTQNAFRFVVEGEGVWTVVNGDPVAMRRGDFLLTPGWHFHGHQNVTDHPMAWIDGLDIPFVHKTDTAFFELGPDVLSDERTPQRSRAERLWAHPGLQPVALLGRQPNSPIAAYRWEPTDRALVDQLAVEAEGYPATVEPGHAAIRFSNPTSGGDVMPTIRAEFHRLRPGTETAARREVGSSRTHIQEMGRELPPYPTLFAKFAEALIGPYDDLVLPAESDAVDWEAELAVVIGQRVRHADGDSAQAAIAGYAVANDVSMRDWQFRTSEWLQGKTFEATTPFGPHLVTTDEVAPDAQIVCAVDGETVQSSRISDLVFSPVELVRYISTILTLSPGDVIIIGTMGGVGHARKPPAYLHPGQKLVTRIDGVGELVTPVLGPEAAR